MGKHKEVVRSTPYPELNLVLEELVARARTVLAENFVAAYLLGSFAVGDFDEYSDVDFLIVTEEDLSETQLVALQAMHVGLYDLGSDWAKHLEGSYIRKGMLNQVEAVGVEPLWYLDNGSRELIPSTHDNHWVVRWVLREHGIALAGPESKVLMGPVPPDALRDEVLVTMRDWGRSLLADPGQMNSRWYQPFVVLSYCRMLQTLATRTIQSKRRGAEWGQAMLEPQWAGLIQRAWEERPEPWAKVHQSADAEDWKRTQDFIRYALEESERFAVKGRTE